MRKNISIFIFIMSLAVIFSVSAIVYSEYKKYYNVTPPQFGKNLSPTDQITNIPDEKIIAPEFSLEDINGKKIALSDYKNKIVILNFWAVWCRYCKIEMPDLNELNKELDKYNAVLLAIDVEEDIDTVKNYLSKNNIDITVLMDYNGEVAQRYNISGFPTTYILNTDNSIYTSFSGPINKQTMIDTLEKMKGNSL